MLAITTPPFFRYRGEELCAVCESHKDNEFWCCDACVDKKPKVAPDAKDGRTNRRFVRKDQT